MGKTTVKMAVTGVQCAKAMGTRMNGISGRTIRSKKARRMSRSLARTGKSRRMICQAKYGDDNVFFDLDDLENTSGNWDRYGSDDPRRYPDQQAEFFELAGAIAAAGYGAVGAKDAKLPITIG